MTDNIFIGAMTTEQKTDFENIKKNKAFAIKLHDHLNRVFYTHHEIENRVDSVTIKMRTQSNHNFYSAYGFIATKNRVMFFMWNELIFDTKKYNGLVEELMKHPKSRCDNKKYALYMDINEDDPNLNEKLQIILKFMDGKYTKRF